MQRRRLQSLRHRCWLKRRLKRRERHKNSLKKGSWKSKPMIKLRKNKKLGMPLCKLKELKSWPNPRRSKKLQR